jgi:hypothetical protein
MKWTKGMQAWEKVEAEANADQAVRVAAAAVEPLAASWAKSRHALVVANQVAGSNHNPATVAVREAAEVAEADARAEWLVASNAHSDLFWARVRSALSRDNLRSLHLRRKAA